MGRIRDTKLNRKFPSLWDDDNDDSILAKDMNDPKEQVLTAAEDGNLESLKDLIGNNPSLLSVRIFSWFYKGKVHSFRGKINKFFFYHEIFSFIMV